MYKKIRKSVADVIANVDDPEQFEWKKWLKEPQIYLEKFPKPTVSIQDINSYQQFPSPSLYQVKNFGLTKTKVSNEIKNVMVPKKKSFKIFFSFPKPYQKQINILNSKTAKLVFALSFFYKNIELFQRTVSSNKETVVSLKTETFTHNIDELESQIKSDYAVSKKVKSVKKDTLVLKSKVPIKKIELPLKASIKDCIDIQLLNFNTVSNSSNIFIKADEIPQIFNIKVLSEEEIKKELQKSDQKHVLSLPITSLPDKAKQQNINFTPLDKIRVPLYHLKNFQTMKAKLTPDRLKLLQEAEVLKGNFASEPKLKIEIADSGTSSLLANVTREEKKEKNEEKQVIENNPAEPKKAKQKVKAVNWEDVEQSHKVLSKYQREGVHFLLQNKKALLSDELGTESKIQVVCALVASLRTGKIKNALIVCTPQNIGNRIVAKKIGISEGWENQISIWGPELNASVINSDSTSDKSEPSDDTKIFITTYDDFLTPNSELGQNKIFSSVDCLILDEAQKTLANKVDPETLFRFPESKYLWIISSYNSKILEERLIPTIKNHLPSFEKFDNLLSRSKHDLKNDLPEVTRQDYWLQLDKEQQMEFDNTIAQGRNRILDLVNSGNPFILQSNIFTLIHQIKQIGNFAKHSDNSPKTDLLLEHLDAILTNGQKTIIFSQYDKQGFQKIDKLLKANNIRYVPYQSGMPLKELENSVNRFRSESKIQVMIAGLTAATIKMKLAEAPYFIHFDQWWNPINQWQYEDKTTPKTDASQTSNHLSVLNYYTNNPVEINIRKTLHKKGLLNKTLIDSLSNEIIYNLVSNEDWLDILGIEHQKLKKSKIFDMENVISDLSELNCEQLGQKVKALFTKLGFKNLLLKPDTLNNQSFVFGFINKGVSEIKAVTLCLPFNIDDPQNIDSFIKEVSKINTRLFIVCSKELSKNAEGIFDEEISWIDQESLAQYLTIFKIN